MKNSMKLRVIGLAFGALLLAAGCAEKGEPPLANVPPNTLVSGFLIATAPATSTYYSTTVYWRGSDADGYVIAYRWRVIGDVGDSVIFEGNNISRWQSSTDVTTTINLSFPSFTKSYIFEVTAQDDDREWDPTPGRAVIAKDRLTGVNYPPNTEISVGPPNGAITGRGIHFVIAGTDIDGVMSQLDYKVDTDADWTRVDADVASGTATVDIRGLEVGSRTILFRAVDNLGGVDLTPASVSVTVDSTLAPELSLSIRDGAKFVVPFTNPVIETLHIVLNAVVDFYYSAIDSYVVITSEDDTITVTEDAVDLLQVGLGDHWVNVIAYDIGGNSTATGQVDYEVIEVQAGDGVLCINGVDWATYGSQAVNFWANGVAWGNRTHYKWWDLFEVPPAGGRPNADSLIGLGAPPAWLFDTLFFDAVVWCGNNYAGDLAYWEDLEETIMAYLEMGGNVILPTRFGADFFFDELTAYAHVDPDQWMIGVNPSSLTSQVDSLTNISRIASQSLTDIPVTDGHSSVTVLYVAPNVAGGHAGFITMPNGVAGGGAFCFIAGRNYRWSNAQLKSNIDVILRYYMGIAN